MPSRVVYLPAPRRPFPAGPLVAVAVFATLMYLSSGHGLHKAKARAPAVAAQARAATAVAYAVAQVGKPYIYGGPTQPGTSAGFDCSGLAQAAWAKAGVSIPRTSEDQWRQLRHVPAGRAEPGDLIIYTGSAIDAPPGHVTIYLGHGRMVEAYGAGYPIRITAIRPGWWGFARP